MWFFGAMFGHPQNNLNIYNVIHATVKGRFMKKIFILLSLCFLSFFSFSQQTVYYQDPQAKFNEAKEYFQKEQYNLAYPILKELQQSDKETNKINDAIEVQ